MRGYYPDSRVRQYQKENLDLDVKLELLKERIKFLKKELKKLGYKTSMRGKDPEKWELILEDPSMFRGL